ncbi:hypothetical protein MJO28_000923 [Puccinia striiformis f. sp. tritici]|uniref:Uncharacterized protein n=1 Tax=Puccinia striiformis f. sp. tritici TaxID=168172 RepID=A0ACC0F0F3_9BASI|nr:hypothetical protein MJO28_000923 [Puccinia striiformis f. sp. tritici]
MWDFQVITGMSLICITLQEHFELEISVLGSRRLQIITNLAEITKNLPPTDPACLRARTFAMNIMNTFQPGDLSTIAACGRIAERLLGSDWTQKEVFDPKSDWNLEGDSEGTPVFAIGHCHIDVCYQLRDRHPICPTLLNFK